VDSFPLAASRVIDCTSKAGFFSDSCSHLFMLPRLACLPHFALFRHLARIIFDSLYIIHTNRITHPYRIVRFRSAKLYTDNENIRNFRQFSSRFSLLVMRCWSQRLLVALQRCKKICSSKGIEKDGPCPLGTVQRLTL